MISEMVKQKAVKLWLYSPKSYDILTKSENF